MNMQYICLRCVMAMKSVSIRFEEEMLEKIGYVAEYEGRSVNSQVLVLVRECIKRFEQEHEKLEEQLEIQLNQLEQQQEEVYSRFD